MKRDLGLIRELLFRIEEFPPSLDDNYNYEIICKGYDKQTIDYHLYRIRETNLIEGNIHRSVINKRISVHYETLELTSRGHDFLDAIRKNTVWNKLKKGLLKSKIPSEIVKGSILKIIEQLLK